MRPPHGHGKRIGGNKIRKSGKNGNTARPARRPVPVIGNDSSNKIGKTGKIGNAARQAQFLNSSDIVAKRYLTGKNSGNISGKNGKTDNDKKATNYSLLISGNDINPMAGCPTGHNSGHSSGHRSRVCIPNRRTLA
ncbi:MAG TPA: hypothetical protein VF510_13260 [Ktedonobacterales bacterium]